MRHALVAAGALSIFAFCAHGAWAGEAEPSCVSCHRKARGSAGFEHSFQDWEHSTHAKSGVSCHACHGGNPAGQTKEEAHSGIQRSTDPKSRLYFTKIPETCGSCHIPELTAFKTSRHYGELERSGRGPNCITCHDSMANHVIASKDMEMTCALCHRPPIQAYAARMAILETRDSLRKLDKEIQRVREAKTIDPGPQERLYRHLLQQFNDISIEWHTFNMARVLSEALDITKQASAAYTELKLRGRKP